MEHNLNNEELAKALAGVATSEGIVDEVIDTLEKARKLACDCEVKPARDPFVRKLILISHDMYLESMHWIMGYIDEVLQGDRKAVLMKANNYLARPLSLNEVKAIQQAVRERFGYLAAQMESDYSPSAATLKKWKALGFIDDRVTGKDFVSMVPETKKVVRNAFVFGRLEMALEEVARGGGGNFEDVLKQALGLPLTKPSKYAIQIAEQQAGNHITSFGDSIAKEIGNAILDKNRSIVKELAVNFHRKKLQATKLHEDAPDALVTDWQGFSSELYHRLDDRAKDYDRIAFYELNDSKRQGKAYELVERWGPDKYVYKEPKPTACPQCKALYLDADGTPKLFKLGDMLEAGNNIGKKPMPVRQGEVVSDERPDGMQTYDAVAGLVHPYCQCGGPNIFTGLEYWAAQKGVNP